MKRIYKGLIYFLFGLLGFMIIGCSSSSSEEILSPEEIKWGTPTTNQAASYALRFLLSSSNNKDPEHWAKIIQYVIQELELDTSQRRAFAAQCSARLKKMAENAEAFATSHSHKHQAQTINISALTSVFDLIYKENHKYESNSGGTPTPISSSQIDTNTNTQQLPQPSPQPVVQSQPQPQPAPQLNTIAKTIQRQLQLATLGKIL
jgi:uncharacterized protein YggL (DUF469 family)